MLSHCINSSRLKLQVTPMLICKVALLACFIPTRGSVFGINSGTLLVACCFAQFLLTRRKVRIPVFYIVYTLFMAVCIVYHFATRTPYIHLIQICQIVGLVYIVLAAVRGNRKKFDELIDYVVIIASIYGLFGIIESFLKLNIFDILTGTEVVYEYANALRFGLARSRGATGTSINNGMLLCLMEGIVAYRLINCNSKKKLYTAAYIIVFINCFCTLSRGVWLDFAISQALIFCMLRGDKKLMLVLKVIAVSAVVFVLGMFLFPEAINGIVGIFNSMMESTIVSLSGESQGDQMGGIGDRLELWGWVWIATQGSLTWGKGFNSAFAYLTSAGAIKESIEVMWLYMLYRTGFVGMVGFILLQLGSLKYSIHSHLTELKSKIMPRGKVGFNYIFFSVSIAYYIAMFSCAGSEDLVFYYFFIGLLFSYNETNETGILVRNSIE